MSDEWAPEAPRTLPPEGILATRKIRILSDADAYKNNLQWSQLAVDYAKEALPIGSSNKLGDIASSLGGSVGCVVGMRIRRKFDGQRFPTMIDYIRYVAASGRKAKCGNCGELSALAFIFLYDNGVRPLDWMEIKNGDHNFVLIGRKKTRDITDPRTWGARCVVSDPWKNWVGAGESVGTMKNPSPVGYGNSEYNEVIQYDTAHRED